MNKPLSLLDKISWTLIVVLCATIGLAPFSQPHIVEKLALLTNAELTKPLDWFDLLFHGLPWALLMAKTVAHFRRSAKKRSCSVG